MRRVKINTSTESSILTGMIISDRFLRDVQTIYNPRNMKSSHAKKIAKWCLDYYTQYKKAPGIHIQDIYSREKKAGSIPEDDALATEKILSRLSREFKRADKFNIDYLLKQAESYFYERAVRRLIEDLDDSLLKKNIKEADQLLTQFKPIQLPSSGAINPFINRKAIRRAFTDSRTPLFKVNGALGSLLNGDLCRQSFIAFMGREKIGKTWNLMELAFQAARQRCNVAFFQAGDMSEEQQIRRIHIRLSGRSDRMKYCGKILIPVIDCQNNLFDSCDLKFRKSKVGMFENEKQYAEALQSKQKKREAFDQSVVDGYRVCDACKDKYPRNFRGGVWYKEKNICPLTWEEAAKAGARFNKRMGNHGFKLATYPNRTLTVREIHSQLDMWEIFDGFIPDVILIDYADILDHESNSDFRHKSNEIWMALRALSQERNCLVITATQADAASYNKKSLGLQNFSEDKRKYSHVTSMITLNQTPEEKVAGIMRSAQLMVRDDDFDINLEAKVLQCYSIGRANLGSFF